MGAWIEMIKPAFRRSSRTLSLPLWERGLKFENGLQRKNETEVAPLVGAWIEIVQDFSLLVYRLGRSPCGRVD